MKAKRIDHIAIAVKDLDAAVATYQHNFGLEKVSGGAVQHWGFAMPFCRLAMHKSNSSHRFQSKVQWPIF